MSDDKKTRKQRVHPDVVMARAQIALTFIMLMAIICLTVALVFFHNEMTDRTFSLISGTNISLVALLTMSWNYFFARQRPGTLPDTSNNTGGNHAPLSTGGTLTVTPDDARNLTGPG